MKKQSSKWKISNLEIDQDGKQNGLKKLFNWAEEERQIPLQWKESNKVTIQRRRIKRKNQESQRGIFITNIVSKAYEIVKKTQNEAAQNYMYNMQTVEKKNRFTLDNIAIRRKGHKNTYFCFDDTEKSFDKFWLKDCLIEMEEIGYTRNNMSNKQKSRNNHRYNIRPNWKHQYKGKSKTRIYIWTNNVLCNNVKSKQYRGDSTV